MAWLIDCVLLNSPGSINLIDHFEVPTAFLKRMSYCKLVNTELLLALTLVIVSFRIVNVLYKNLILLKKKHTYPQLIIKLLLLLELLVQC